MTSDEFKEAIEMKLETIFSRTVENASENQIYKAVAITLRDCIMRDWTVSKSRVYDKLEEDGKQVFYLSMEFLMGRFLLNNLTNLLKDDKVKEACEDLGLNFDEIIDKEPDAGLGNGGLGRLAACFLDSIATLSLPGHGNGIRYEYGLFKQEIIDGYQVEVTDPWLEDGNVWEIAKLEEPEFIYFGGHVEYREEKGRTKVKQVNCQTVKAVPYDVPVVGYDSKVINTLRLWGARSLKALDMGLFGQGQYVNALAEKESAEVISKVLYPEDNHPEGKMLRLKQQYFFASASIQSIIRKYKSYGGSINIFHKKNVIHINDTHPVLAIPEFMRILLDEDNLSWDRAWYITKNTFAYTNHTTLPEALETWSEDILKQLLPRIYDIIKEINERFCKDLFENHNVDLETISKMAIVSYNNVHMAKLAIVGSFSVNGVAELHGEILKKETFKDFYKVYPKLFTSITNGVTHRRFLLMANKELASLITEKIGDKWIKDSFELKKLLKYKDDTEFQNRVKEIRYNNKLELSKYILKNNDIKVDPNSIFDIHVKRLHEYKRQLLNIMHIMYLYNRLLEDKDFDMHPRTFIFGAKSAPGYHKAKLIIKLIHSIGEKINNDKRINGKIKVVFLENYRVSLAQKIFPATDISKQISTAGKEASGTGNMKFMLNGALTVGTLDGANIEMKREVGNENILIFGLNENQVQELKQSGEYNPYEIYKNTPKLKQVLDQLVNGFIEPENPELFRSIYQDLLFGYGGEIDPYLVIKDFEDFCRVNDEADRIYKDQKKWWSIAISNIASSGYFSSDRTINQYNDEIWKLKKID